MGNHDIEVGGDKKSPNMRPEIHPDTDKGVSEEVENVTIILTEEDNQRIKRKTDWTILSLLTWIYFLQVLDKAVLGTGSVFNLQEDTHLTGSQYSLVASISPIAQLAWQPFSAWLIVKVPQRILMPLLVFGWGTAQTCLAACYNFGGMLAARFFLGLFEAGCLPLFAIITGQWYRRIEQPVRVSIWYSTNGLATMAASALSYGLGHIPSNLLRPWQIIFLFVGLVTVVSAPLVYWKLDNDITTARFLTKEERLQGAKRLRANQTGATSYEFKWSHVLEVAIEPKAWLWVAMAILPNMGSAMTSIFGPLIVKGFGFDKFQTSLLNIPFGAVQTIVIVFSCWASYKAKLKGVVLAGFMVPVIAGCAMLYALDHTKASNQGALLAAYYLCAFLFSANPILLAWVVGNTAGATKQSTTLALYQAGVSAGALSGPLLFSDDQAPNYRPGTRSVLIIFIVMIACVLIQLANLVLLNQLQKKKRVRNGKSATLVDQSMMAAVTHADENGKGEEGVLVEGPDKSDLTDRQNDEFVYIY
ncbi:Mfs transporter [Aspergillus sclerotialis]|uniref:Mfs transporter n=1 Tax=Aspergillus sclerotialis TaxID=2070753 RepID=A0A3A3A7D4_9EURO|nr:Mfs transporter [Aspergillus sclerotialis]